MGLSAIVVTHDLAVVRLLADRLMVMKDGHVIETGLTDQVLDDPQLPTRSFWSVPFCRCEGGRTMIDVENLGKSKPSRCTTRVAWLSRFWKVRASRWRPANAWR
jgi:ABC-type glutathione transport system ATPase component